MNFNSVFGTRYGIIALALSVATLGLVGCDKKLNNDKNKASYAIGQQIGQNLKNQNIDFDPDVLAMSMKDVVAGKPSQMKPEDMQTAMKNLQEGMQKKSQQLAETNLVDGKKFLDENKAKADVKTTASGLQYTVMKEGDGKSPKETDTVKAHYRGTLTNGQQFDSSYDRGQPAEFPLNQVIKGWTEGLQLMKIGGKIKLVIPPDMAYGSVPRPGIPANSVLVFEVELIDIVAPSKDAAPAAKPAAKPTAEKATKAKKK